MTYFLGLDLGLAETGITLLSDNGTPFHIGSLCPPKLLEGVPRLQWIGDRLIDAMGDEIVGAAVEGYSFGSQSQAHKIGELGGFVRMLLYHKRIPTILVPPNTLKKFATGKGSSPKAVMIREVWKRWNVEVSSDDQADSVALAHMARYHFSGDWHPTLAYQHEAMGACQELPTKPRERVRALPRS